ncbi:MAG: long-chain fatty acid--CoA ligase [Sphingorhabdus sp.]
MFHAAGLEWSDASLWCQFDALRREDPEAIALFDAEGRAWLRRELNDLAMPLAAQLAEQGVAKNSRVLLEARKNISVVAAVLAITSLGGIVCPYSPGLSETDRSALEQSLGHVLRVCSGSAIAVADGNPGFDFHFPPHSAGRPADPRDAEVALIGFTSGTTGVPKGVMHRWAALNYATRACAVIAGLAPSDSILAIVPWDSAPGFTFTVHFSLSLGHPMVIVDPWSPQHALQLAERHRCAWAICVPTHLFAMVEEARSGRWKGKLSFRALAVGGSSMTTELIVDARDLLGIKALRMFGMSECMGHASTRTDDDDAHFLHSDGLPFPGTQDVAFGPDLQPLPPGERGQAGVRGPSLFLGYASGMGENSAQFTPDGFLLTGDEIVCEPSGYLKVVGRIKDQIIRGGFNIDPAEVEASILRLAGIVEAVVVGVPHAKLGEQCCAVCRLASGAREVGLEDVLAHLASEGLSKKKWPEHLVVVEAIQHTANGKVDKKSIAALACNMLKIGIED